MGILRDARPAFERRQSQVAATKPLCKPLFHSTTLTEECVCLENSTSIARKKIVCIFGARSGQAVKQGRTVSGKYTGLGQNPVEGGGRPLYLNSAIDSATGCCAVH